MLLINTIFKVIMKLKEPEMPFQGIHNSLPIIKTSLIKIKTKVIYLLQVVHPKAPQLLWEGVLMLVDLQLRVEVKDPEYSHLQTILKKGNKVDKRLEEEIGNRINNTLIM